METIFLKFEEWPILALFTREGVKKSVVIMNISLRLAL